MNIWTNEYKMNKLTYKWLNTWINEHTDEQMKECMDKHMN